MAFTFTNFQPSGPQEYGLQNLIAQLMSGAAESQALQKTAAELPYAGEMAKSTAAYKKAMANYLSNPYQAQRFLSPLGKLINEQKMGGGQSNMEGETSDEGGGSLDPYALEIQKHVSDPQQRHKAQAAQIIYNQVNDIDTKPLEKFAGLGGKIRGLLERGKGAASSVGIGQGPSQEFRDYNSYMAINKNAIMDAIRQALQTSVVPAYVQSTLAPMVDPTSTIWNDPQQVKQNIKTLKQWLKPYAGEQTAAFAKGVPTSLEQASQRHGGFTNEPIKSIDQLMARQGKEREQVNKISQAMKPHEMTSEELLELLKKAK